MRLSCPMLLFYVIRVILLHLFIPGLPNSPHKVADQTVFSVDRLSRVGLLLQPPQLNIYTIRVACMYFSLQYSDDMDLAVEFYLLHPSCSRNNVCKRSFVFLSNSLRVWKSFYSLRWSCLLQNGCLFLTAISGKTVECQFMLSYEPGANLLLIRLNRDQCFAA